MAKKLPQPKDPMRITIRFRNEAVADEFHRRAAEANQRPSPFAAKLIEQALAESDVQNCEQDALCRELNELRNSVETLRELPQALAEGQTNNDDTLSELAALRRDIGELKDTAQITKDLSDNLQEFVREFGKLQDSVSQLAALPHVFVKLREDVATAIHPLLVRSGNLSPREAEEWIRRNLLEE